MNRKSIFWVSGLFVLGLATSCGAVDVREPLRVTLTFDLEGRDLYGCQLTVAGVKANYGSALTPAEIREPLRQAFSFVPQADDERLSLKLGGFGQSVLSGHVRISHVRLWKETKGKAGGK